MVNAEDRNQSRTRLLLILMIAVVLDAITSFIAKASGGFVTYLPILIVLFVLQESFRLVRLICIGMLSLWIFYGIVQFINHHGLVWLKNFLTSWITYPELRPLTLALVLLVVFSFRVTRKYNFKR